MSSMSNDNNRELLAALRLLDGSLVNDMAVRKEGTVAPSDANSDSHEEEEESTDLLTSLTQLGRQVLAERGLPVCLADNVARDFATSPDTAAVLTRDSWLRAMKAEVALSLRENTLTVATPTRRSCGPGPSTTPTTAVREVPPDGPQAVQFRLSEAVFRTLKQSGALCIANGDSFQFDFAAGHVTWQPSAGTAVTAAFSPGDPFSVLPGSCGGLLDAAKLRDAWEADARRRTMQAEIAALRDSFPIDWDREAGVLRFIAGRRGVLVELDVGSAQAIRVVSVAPGGSLPQGCIPPAADAPLIKWLQCLECEFHAPPTPPVLQPQQLGK